MSKLNPAIRTDSKRTPVSTIDANSSLARVRFCSSVSASKRSGTFASEISSSGRTCPSPISPGTSTSGSTMRFSEAVDRRSMRCSVRVSVPAGRGFVVVVFVCVSMVGAIPAFFMS